MRCSRASEECGRVSLGWPSMMFSSCRRVSECEEPMSLHSGKASSGCESMALGCERVSSCFLMLFSSCRRLSECEQPECEECEEGLE